MGLPSAVPLAGVFLLAATPLLADLKPVTVSPGDTVRIVQTADSCPTFSWGEVENARGWELVVYRIAEAQADSQMVLRKMLHGSASSWTPSLEECLQRGGQFAWSVRATQARGETSWSVPRLFQVATGPSHMALERALAVVQEYVGKIERAPDQEVRAQIAEPLPPTAPAAISLPAASPPDPAAASPPPRAEPETTVPEPPATVALILDGALGVGTNSPLADLHVVGSPTLGGLLIAPDAGVNQSSELMLAEDDDGTFGMKLKYDGLIGSNENRLEIWGRTAGVDNGPWLTIWRDTGKVLFAGPVDGVNPDPPCFSTDSRFVDCGNGTVTDTVNGLVWLKDASCFTTQDFPTANDQAAALSHGQCGLSDGSRTGDWRLATPAEWDAVFEESCATGPKIVGKDFGCYSDADNAWATGLDTEALYWSSATAYSATRAHLFDVDQGLTLPARKQSSVVARAWPVRSGQALNVVAREVCDDSESCGCQFQRVIVGGGADCGTNSVLSSYPSSEVSWRATCSGGGLPSISILCVGGRPAE